MNVTNGLPNSFCYVSTKDAPIYVKWIGAIIIAWSSALALRAIWEGHFGLRSVPFHLAWMGIGGALVFVTAQIELTPNELKFRIFRKWNSIPRSGIEKVWRPRFGFCLLRIAWKGHRRYIAFKLSGLALSSREPEVVYVLRQIIGVAGPATRPMASGGLDKITLPLKGRPLSTLKGVSWFGATFLVGWGQFRESTISAADQATRGNGSDLLWWIYTGPGLGLFVLLMMIILYRRWDKNLGTRDLEIKGHLIFTIGFLGFFLGANLERFGVLPLNVPIPRWLSEEGVVGLAILLLILVVILFVRMYQTVSEKHEIVRGAHKIGLHEVLQVKEIYRQAFPDSHLDRLFNLMVLLAAYFLGIWFLAGSHGQGCL